MTVSLETVTNAESPFGRLVRQHRDRLGLTQRELSDFSTVSVRAIRDIEQGRAKRPRNDTVRLIADGLRLSAHAREALVRAAKADRPVWAVADRLAAEPLAPPTAPHPLHGRHAEADALYAELSGRTGRLVSLVGLAGTGRTRLALEVAARLHQDGMTVLWHALAPAAPGDYRRPAEPDGLSVLLGACVRELFSPDRSAAPPGQPGGSAGWARMFEPRDAHPGWGLAGLSDSLAARPALLVLDAVDPQLRARPDAFAQLLQHCPDLRILVTSADPLGLPGERLVPVAPLPLPEADEHDLDRLRRSPAVGFFLEEAQRARPGSAPDRADVRAAAQICRSLDGVPGALRAAASWLVVYDMAALRECLAGSPAALLGHLSGPEGGFGIREALERRVARLSGTDAAVLAALCAADTALAVCDLAEPAARGLPECGRAVRSLLLAGLIRPASPAGGDRVGRPRFRALNLVRAVQLTAGTRRGE